MRIRALSVLYCSMIGFALGACATNTSPSAQPAAVAPVASESPSGQPASGAPQADTGSAAPAEALDGLVLVEDVDVVQVDLADNELAEPQVRISCYLEHKPGSRIVVGEVCVGIPTSSDAAFHPDDWDLDIISPGVYQMRPRR